MSNEKKRQQFARMLRYYIALTGKQQKEVAKQLNINPTTFNTWANGRILPSVEKLDKLAEYFGTSRNNLLGEKDPVLTESEKALIEKYRAAPESRREAVRVLLDLLEKEYLKNDKEGDK